MSEARRVQDSESWQSYLIMNQHINGYGRLFGGILIGWIDQLAGIVSRRHAGAQTTTAAIDSLVFHGPAFVDDLLVLHGRVTYVGTSSMEVRVDAYRETQDGMRHLINRAYVVMVAIDDQGRPQPVPRLIREDARAEFEWASGAKRYQLRKQRQAEGY